MVYHWLRTNPLGIRMSRLAALVVVAALATLSSAHAAESDESPIVRAIDIEATHFLNEEEMRAVVQHTVVGAPLDYEALSADMQAIFDLGIERHGEQVFYDIEAELLAEGDGVRVVFIPVDMPVIAGFTIDTDVLNEGWLHSLIGIEPGEVLNVGRLHEAIIQAVERVREEEGLWLEVTDLQMDSQNVVRLQLRAVRVSSVQVEGNEKTRDYVIEREIRTAAGQPLRRDLISGDVRRIFQLRFFDDVEPEVLTTEDPLWVDVVYRVKERQTGQAGFGAGYSSRDGFIGYIEVADENLFGRGQRGNVRWEFGQRSSSYDLGFFDPNIAGSGTSAGFNLYNRTTKLVDQIDNQDVPYTVRRIGGDVTVGRRFTDFLQGFARLKVENVTNRPDEAHPTWGGDEHRTRSITLGVSTDSTDTPFYPTEGLRTRGTVEIAGKFLGGDTDFTKYQAEVSTYRKVGRNNQVLAMRLMGGFAGEPLPLQESFRVGGAETVRGYNYGAMRGDKMLVGNAEYRFRLSDAVQGVVFADLGQAWSHNEGMALSELRSAVGLGVRFETPLGIMRLDYGFGDEGGRAFFSLGPAF